MNKIRRTAALAGSLFLFAMVSSLLGGGLIESVLNVPDYFSEVSSGSTTLLIGISLEFLNGIAVIGIAVSLFPVLKRHSESMAAGYLSFRIIESLFCIAAAAIPLLIISLRGEYIKAGDSDSSNILTLSAFLISVRTLFAALLIPLFFGVGALLFYYLLYRMKLVARYISVWGLIGAVLIIMLIFFEAGMVINMIFVLPIILNEIFLGVWLIAKGFNLSTVLTETA